MTKSYQDLDPVETLTPTYLYTGYCPVSGELLQLPRTIAAESIACQLMAQLAQDEQFGREGKMYGVLVVATKTGEQQVLQAFSGLLDGVAEVAGWVPPIPGRELIIAAEQATLADLAAMKQELIELARLPEREEYRILAGEFATRLELLSIEQRQRKELRQREREKLATTLNDPELAIALEKLTANSRQDSRERRQLKQERDLVLQPLQAILDRVDGRILELKQQRKTRSRQLQTQMHNAYRLMNFLGTSSSLRELMPAGIPTGTGDCCAPKLLHYAASNNFKPLAMAEFWWGAPSDDKQQGEFYGACQDRCQPLMGFMLSGLASQISSNLSCDLPIIYEDEYLIAIDKPPGLLSIPGRDLDRQDSVITQLRQYLPDREVYPVHRLDRDTSGILLIALNPDTHRQISRQFQVRQVHKIYEAILAGEIDRTTGTIDLPLWGDPDNRPRQTVDFDRGKPSLTKFQVLGKVGTNTRIEFYPITGRTHQLRVHAAAPQGLGMPILGDRLYGCQAPGSRLHLHARELTFIHPVHTTAIQLHSVTKY